MPTYDFVIAGGGSAASVAAWRLVKEFGFRVLMLERGLARTNRIMAMPAGYMKYLGQDTFLEMHKTVPQPQLGGRAPIVPVAKVLGGGSSVNAMVYMRGQKEDYDGWAQSLGNDPSWSYESELGILCWPNLEPLAVDLVPLLTMRERVPLVVTPEIAAKLPARPTLANILDHVPRVISLRWWQVEPEGASAFTRMAQTSVELPTGPARRLAIKGEGTGFFVQSAIADDLAAGRLVEIQPVDAEPLHRDTAMVVRSLAALDRPMLVDFIREIAGECARVGTILDSRLEDLLPAA